ncbi:MAG: hypothetical protein EOO22_28165, partial [Comamonadaceae bacterium]
MHESDPARVQFEMARAAVRWREPGPAKEIRRLASIAHRQLPDELRAFYVHADGLGHDKARERDNTLRLWSPMDLASNTFRTADEPRPSATGLIDTLRQDFLWPDASPLAQAEIDALDLRFMVIGWYRLSTQPSTRIYVGADANGGFFR